MRLLAFIILITSMHGYSQSNYEKLLLLRLVEIEKLPHYNNSVVVYSETSGYGSTFDRWVTDREFYRDEMVIGLEGQFYRALVDNRDKNPSESPNEWELIPYTHPYFFLRDTAKVEDLRELLSNEHPYVKTYAFGALAHRKLPGLYEVMMENLGDTTRISQITSDYGYDVCPADLMISYLLMDMTEQQKKQLLRLIKTKYRHLEDAKRILSER